MSADLVLRDARVADTALVLRFIEALAVYEKLEHEARATEAQIRQALFGDNPRVFCRLAEWQGEPAGFALWYYTFSTFQGRHGIWLEDLFVYEAFRGKGIGKALLADLAKRCLSEGLGRLEWAVLDWNTPSIAFYKAQGAVMMAEWERCRVEGEALDKLAGTA